MRVLQLTVHLFPNVGGVETHLKDLFRSLMKRNYKIFVLSYQPLSTKTSWKVYEKDKNLTILRIPWIRGFFEKLVPHPKLEFIYLIPGLFIFTPIAMMLFRPNIIHAHGLIAATSASFWGQLLGIRVVISLHSFYSFQKKGLYKEFVSFILRKSDYVLSLSRKSNEEVKVLGVRGNKAGVFTYWVDLEKFKKIPNAKQKLNWENMFVVLFVGRLIREKGIDIVLQSARLWDKNIRLVIIGAGPMEKVILEYANQIRQVQFLGKIDQQDLPLYYSAADLVIVPSTSEEGFGRVIIESLACQTPVIASKRGAISEAMNETVGKFIDTTPKDIQKAVEYFYKNPKELLKFSRNARQFAERRYAEVNVEQITKAYTQ